MENPTPFDLNETIRHWQQNIGASPALNSDNIEELTSHLRASVQRLKAAGLSEEEAFLIAARRLGEHGPLEREFAKVNPMAAWSFSAFMSWAVIGIFLFHAILVVSDRVWPLNWYQLTLSSGLGARCKL